MNLTSREIECLELISIGYSDKDMAKKFGISLSTVKNHISNIYRKMDIRRNSGNLRVRAILKYREMKREGRFDDYFRNLDCDSVDRLLCYIGDSGCHEKFADQSIARRVGMKIGMMWAFGKSEKGLITPIDEAIRDAMNYFIDKYGLRPTVCVINDLQEDPTDTNYLKIEKRRYVLPSCLWIGVSDESMELRAS